MIIVRSSLVEILFFTTSSLVQCQCLVARYSFHGVDSWLGDHPV